MMWEISSKGNLSDKVAIITGGAGGTSRSFESFIEWGGNDGKSIKE